MGGAAAAAVGAELLVSAGADPGAGTLGGGGRAGGSFLRGGRDGSWWEGVWGGGSRDIEDSEEDKSFKSSSFSVFRAKQKSETLLLK